MSLAAVALWVGVAAWADETVVLEGPFPADPVAEPFVTASFEVPVGTRELSVVHSDSSDASAVDWGLLDPSGALRGWHGSNTSAATVGELAATPGYVPGPLPAGTWEVLVGFPNVTESGTWRAEVTVRTEATLPADPDVGPYVPPAPLRTTPGWFAGDFHVHSVHSGDARPTLDEIADYAASAGLDFVEISEHDTPAHLSVLSAVQRRHPGVLLVPGIEWTTYRGHAIAIGITEAVPFTVGFRGVTATEAADRVHALGGLFSLAHPTLDLGTLCWGCAWEQELDVLPLDGLEVQTQSVDVLGTLLLDGTLALWDSLCDQGRHVVALGGSDDHTGGSPGPGLGSAIGEPTTLVEADELSVAGIVAGVKAGRTVVKLGGPQDPMVVLDADGRQGDTVRADRVEVRARVTGGAGGQLLVVRNGEPAELVDVPTDDFTWTGELAARGEQPARLRVHVLRDGLPRTITSHLWVEPPPLPTAPPEVSCGCASSGGAGLGLGVASVALLVAATRRRPC